MAGTISQYQQSAFATPVNGAVADATVVLSNDNATRAKHNSHDADATIHVQSSLLANRPAAATAQRVWLTTDTGGVFLALDTGSAWVDLNYIRTTATSLPANVLASSLTSVGVLASPHMTSPTIDSGGMTINAGVLAAQAVTATTVGASTSIAATKTTGGVTVSHVGDQNATTFSVVNSKTCTASMTQGQMIFSVYFGGTGQSCLFAASYDSATITALSPINAESILSSTPGAAQLGIFKSSSSFTISFKAGASLAGTSAVIAISFMGNSVTAVTDWA